MKRAVFLEVERAVPERRPVDERLRDWSELEGELSNERAREQASRCMGCGVPFCHEGCPLGNVIPEWNLLVSEGRWEAAARALHATNNFPEMTGRVCPAPCETSCVLQIERAPVTIERIEGAIADRAFLEGWVIPRPAERRTGKRVAIVGSGPAGLACAQELAREGHEVVVFERADRVGGLLRYGIPDFKLDKALIDRRVEQMRAEGVVFRTGVAVGVDPSLEALEDEYDAVVLAIGATRARDLPIEGRDLGGIHLAMDFLVSQNQVVAGDEIADRPSATGKRVVIIGGGDTGSDCLGTALRQGAATVTQFELMSCPPAEDASAWPDWPMVLRTSSSQEEGGERAWSVLTERFVGDDRVRGLEVVDVEWRDSGMHREESTRRTIDADLVLLAVGFVGPEADPFELACDTRGNLLADEEAYATSRAGVFACGDARRGQSLVVWAIREGREAARSVGRHLDGKAPQR